MSAGTIERERLRIARPFTYAEVGQIFSTLIRHACRVAPPSLAVFTLPVAVVAPAFIAALVALIRCPPNDSLASIAAALATVFVASIVASANEKDRRAEAAGELIERRLGFHFADAKRKELDCAVLSDDSMARRSNA